MLCCCVVLYCVVLCCVVLCGVVWFGLVWFCVVWCCAVLCCAVILVKFVDYFISEVTHNRTRCPYALSGYDKFSLVYLL